LHSVKFASTKVVQYDGRSWLTGHRYTSRSFHRYLRGKRCHATAVSRRLDTHIQRLRTAITSNHLRAATSHSYTAVMRNFWLIRRFSRTIVADVTRRENLTRQTRLNLLHFGALSRLTRTSSQWRKIESGVAIRHFIINVIELDLHRLYLTVEYLWAFMFESYWLRQSHNVVFFNSLSKKNTLHTMTMIFILSL